MVICPIENKRGVNEEKITGHMIFDNGVVSDYTPIINTNITWGGWTVGGTSNVGSTIDMATNDSRTYCILVFNKTIDWSQYTRLKINAKYSVSSGDSGFLIGTTNATSGALNQGFTTIQYVDTPKTISDFTKLEYDISSITSNNYLCILVGRNTASVSIKQIYLE